MTQARSIPRLAWPEPSLAKRAGLWALVIGAEWLLLFQGADWLASRRSLQLSVQWPGEERIPLVPSLTLAYSSLYLMFALTPFLLRTRAALDRFAFVLAFETAVAAVCFVLLPVSVSFPTPGSAELGIWEGPFRLADAINGTHNGFPSLHVAFALSSGAVLDRPHGSRVFTLWALLISISTVLTHQHNVADVLGGGLLALLALRVSERASPSTAWVDAPADPQRLP